MEEGVLKWDPTKNALVTFSKKDHAHKSKTLGITITPTSTSPDLEERTTKDMTLSPG